MQLSAVFPTYLDCWSEVRSKAHMFTLRADQTVALNRAGVAGMMCKHNCLQWCGWRCRLKVLCCALQMLLCSCEWHGT